MGIRTEDRMEEGKAPSSPASGEPMAGRELRWSARRKEGVVLRLLRGESLDALARETGQPAGKISGWREAFLAAGREGLKARPQPEEDRRLAPAQQDIDELAMDNDILRGLLDEVEQRLSEVEAEARREIERELHHREIEGQVGEVVERATEEPEPTKEDEAKEPPPEGPPEEAPTGDLVSLNSASFEQFRELGMSITQAKRVIAYRDKRDGFDSADDLDEVPGFPRAFLAEVKRKLSP